MMDSDLIHLDMRFMLHFVIWMRHCLCATREFFFYLQRYGWIEVSKMQSEDLEGHMVWIGF